MHVEGDEVARVEVGVGCPPGATHLPGAVIPGLANAHSHAFHRALRGRTEHDDGDFWSWREQMYALASRLDPDGYHRLARAVYGEMVLAGYTSVGEFHYLHHGPDGQPYDDPNAMGEALIEAAAEAGIRLTLLDTCYLQGDLEGGPLEGAQLRFSDGDVDGWSWRAGAREEREGVRLGAAIHSVRAVPPVALETVAAWSAEHGAPLHLHLSEQPAENEACRTATGLSPTELVERAGVLTERTTAVHGTHLTDVDIALLAEGRTGVCLCPTTERSLADGIGPSLRLREAGVQISLGSDCHATIDPFEEARALELDQRLATGRRGGHTPAQLIEAATVDGMRALGWSAGEIAPGHRCDLVALDLGSPRLAGTDPDRLAAHVVFAGTAADVTDVVIDGRHVVRDRQHTGIGDVGATLAAAIDAVVEEPR